MLTRYLQSSPLFAVAALALVLAVVSGHDHVKQHSHFCQGAGYSLFCPENQTLSIFKAWYGRVAHDTTTCIPSPTTQGSNQTAQPQPDLPEDCGSSLMESKGSWCQEAEKGGCTITVKDLAPAVEEKKCPDSVIRYFYLEYECLGSGSEAVVFSRGGGAVLAFWLSVLASLLIVSF